MTLRRRSRGRSGSGAKLGGARSSLLFLLLVLLALGACGRRERPLAGAVFPDAGTDPRADAGRSTGPGPIVHLAEGMVGCEPGRRTIIACGCSSFGSCSGDPVIVVCTSNVSTHGCAQGDAEITHDDDTCGLCPQVSFTCPESGEVIVATRSAVDSGYVCDLEGQTQ